MFKKLIISSLSLGLFLVNPGFAHQHDSSAVSAQTESCPCKGMQGKADKKDWMEKLDLSDEQKQKIKAIQDKYRPSIKEGMMQKRKLYHEMMMMSQQKDMDSSKLDSLMEQQNKVSKDVITTKVKMKNEIYQVMDTEQQEKLKEMKQKWMEKRQDKMRQH
ncbi:MAG: Spy/CpxP family protein refolding chaperone [Legionellaceae bacterium]|nr:Spy/CpxP family protein refolding chaperone [Legionellaceae bacterium]